MLNPLDEESVIYLLVVTIYIFILNFPIISESPVKLNHVLSLSKHSFVNIVSELRTG